MLTIKGKEVASSSFYAILMLLLHCTMIVQSSFTVHHSHRTMYGIGTSTGTSATSVSTRLSSGMYLNLEKDAHPTTNMKSPPTRKQFISNLIYKSLLSTTTITATLIAPTQNQYAMATYIDPKTKINLPFIDEIEQAVPANWQDVDDPFSNDDGSNSDSVSSSTSLFTRLDNTNDSIFYTEPRFVEHVDENAVSSIESYVQQLLQSHSKGKSSNNDSINSDINVLDLCSSWTTHISKETKQNMNLNRVSGLGMNEEELKRNPVLTDYTVLNLNENRNTPLPYDDATFDVVLCQLSIDYLIYPLQVMKEIGRILKPNGQIAILFSNRLFLQKAVGLWTGADDIDHAFIVASYLYFSNGGFQTESIQAKDLSRRNKKGMIVGDPLYVVTATKA